MTPSQSETLVELYALLAARNVQNNHLLPASEQAEDMKVHQEFFDAMDGLLQPEYAEKVKRRFDELMAAQKPATDM